MLRTGRIENATLSTVDACPIVSAVGLCGNLRVIGVLGSSAWPAVADTCERVHLLHRPLPAGYTMTHEQATHDRINLYRLVRRLEKSVAEEGWQNPGDLKDFKPFPHGAWIRTQGTLGVSISPSPFPLNTIVGSGI